MAESGTPLLAIDHGNKRTGVAISDPLRIVARPLRVISTYPQDKAFQQLAQLVDENSVSKVIVGLPTDSEGELGQQARNVLQWAHLLAKAISIPVVMWDESFSTEDALAYTGHKKKRKASQPGLDAVAAAVILQSYLEANRGENEPGQPIQTFSNPT